MRPQGCRSPPPRAWWSGSGRPSRRRPRPGPPAGSAASPASSSSTGSGSLRPRPTASARSSILARRAGRLRWCGADLAAHCINDVLTTGAEPLFLLDYVAANRIDLDQVAELVEGAAEVCRAAGCAILGGETAELPGIYQDEELDFAGTCVGLVDRRDLIDGSRVEAGDVVVGFPSAGIHANGFTLVRSLVGDDELDADLLLPPTRLYLDHVRAAQRPRGRTGARARDRGRHHGQPAARAPGRARRGDRLGRLGAAARLRLARRAGRGGGAAARVQPRHRLLRRRPGGRRGRRARDREDCRRRDRRAGQRRGLEPAGAARRRAPRRRGRVEPRRDSCSRPRRCGRGACGRVRAGRLRRPRAARRDDGELAAGARCPHRRLRRVHARS